MIRAQRQQSLGLQTGAGLADADAMPSDVGLPKNAVLGRTYTNGTRKEPGDRKAGVAGVTSLDLREIDEQAADPAWTNRVQDTEFRFPLPFTKKR